MISTMTLATKMTNMTIGPTHFHMKIHVYFRYGLTGLAISVKNLYSVRRAGRLESRTWHILSIHAGKKRELGRMRDD